MSEKNKIGIYVHIPFCKKKCPYCNFFSSVNYDNDKLNQYTDKICSDLEKWSRLGKKADTLYFGGGTPSLLGTNRILKIVESADKFFSVLKNAKSEVTVEMNPSDLELLDFKTLNKFGVNRLSIGLQSSNPLELNTLGRTHTPDSVKKCVYSAQDAGLHNISLDLMILTPHETMESLIQSIEFCSSLNIQHISSYMLKIEPNTAFYKKQKTFSLPDESTASNTYITMCEKLEKLGFTQYEISNFSKPGYKGRHNLKYWNAEEYIGIGPSSHSFIDGERFYYEKSIKDYLNGQKPIKDGPGGDEEEYIMLRLRLTEGLDLQKFKKRFEHDISSTCIKNALMYQTIGLVQVNAHKIQLTRKGFLVSNNLISRLLY